MIDTQALGTLAMLLGLSLIGFSLAYSLRTVRKRTTDAEKERIDRAMGR